MYYLLKDLGIKKNLFESVHLYYDRKFTNIITPFISILDYLKYNAEQYPQELFIIEIVGELETQSVTYRDFYHTLLKVKQVLKNVYDVNSNSKVAVLPENNLASVYLILGVMLCNCTVVVINPNEPSNRISEQIKGVDCATVIINEDDTKSEIKYTATIQEIISKAMLQSNLSYEDIPCFYPYSPAIIIFTTGTTSSSKPVLQMHYNIVINSYALVKHHRLNTKQNLICTLPIYHVNALEFTIFSSIIAGSTVVLCDHFNPSIYFALLNKYAISIASLVPTNFDLLANIKHDEKLPHLKYFVSAAAPLSSKTANVIMNNFNKKIIQGYGLTETTNFSALLPIDISLGDYKTLVLNSDIPSIGQEILGNQVAILREDGTEVAYGEEGEICMRGHNVMAGYLYNSAATQDCFRNGWFHSGDIGKYTQLSSYKQKFLKITGRLKNIIKISGHAVSLDEIDRLIIDIEGVDDAVTCPINNVDSEEFSISFVVNKNNLLTAKNIIDGLSQYLMFQYLPKKIVFVPHIQRMKNGKINRNNLIKEFFGCIPEIW
jgi:acyl-CoA synthetase (AMP-forming)/AMP-acid ligase II